MAALKKQYVKFGKQKLSLGCGTCAYGSEKLGSTLKSKCGQCLSGTKRGFVMDKKYKNAVVQEEEAETEN